MLKKILTLAVTMLSLVAAFAAPEETHEKVQLWEGGPYWATTNIGAEEPWEYGYYFWWGDTVGYKRENDVWVASDGSSSNFSFDSSNTPTYNKSIATLMSEEWITADGVLAPEHDAAHVQWGSSWRMPTQDELLYLSNMCNWSRTTMNGVEGYLVSGTGDYASNSIFLPCAGYSLYYGSRGHYWSSVPFSGNDISWGLYFYSDYYSVFRDTMFNVDRFNGLSVRPVRDDGGTMNSYTVTYKRGANGSGSLQTATKTHGVTLTLRGATFMRSGYTQTGWSTSDGGAKAYDLGASYTANAAITLYPYWTANSGADTHASVQLWAGGPYWATTNIGADEPWDYGYYFWWGDTLGYKRVNNAWVASNGSSSDFSFGSLKLSTYGKDIATLKSEGWITTDGVLAPEHDAAHMQWGGSWRMPTHQELEDLCNKCDRTWTTMNGVSGYVVRGRGDYASASIFLPCAGYSYGTSLYYAGSLGYYWSSVPFSGYYPDSWYIYFNSDCLDTDFNTRLDGHSVRPVQEFVEGINPETPAPVNPDSSTPASAALGYEVIEATDIVAPYEAPKVVTLQGAVNDGGKVVGIVELKLGKVNAKKGTSKVSGSVTTLDGKKHTIKAFNLEGIDGTSPKAVTLEVKDFGTMSVTIGGTQFAGSMGKYHVQSAAVGGDWSKGGTKVYVATSERLAGILALPEGTIEELLPDGESVIPKNGKWSFAKAASVKWAKPKQDAALPERYDAESGKGLVVDTSGDKTNLSAMKLTYTPKKGTFKGSFKVYALEGAGKATKLKKYTIKVSGVVVGGVGYGTATCKTPAVSWAVTVR